MREKTMTIARIAYIYHVSAQVRMMAGHAYANRYNQSGVYRVPEHRSWQQIQWVEHKKGFNFTQAFRVEQRFRRRVRDETLDEGYNFNWRFRYNFTFTIPLRGSTLVKHTPFLLVQDEILVNAGKLISHNYFDQNRSFLGIGYQFTETTSAHLGYLFIFQQDNPPRYLHIHAIRVFVSHNVDWRGRN